MKTHECEYCNGEIRERNVTVNHWYEDKLVISDTTHYLKVGASVSSRLRCFRRNQRLTFTPPAGSYAVSERFYRALSHGYPSLQYIDSSVDVSIVMRLTLLARPVPIGEL